MPATYDVILVGSGFASAMFLARYLEKAPRNARVLVLERGPKVSHAELSRDRTRLERLADETYVNRTPAKPWRLAAGFGGGSNAWGGSTPRLLPEDFRLRTLYGVGRDWPISYDELEPYYCDAERRMAISGPVGPSPYPRSRPYPQPPHPMSPPARRFKSAFPDLFFEQPCARPTLATTHRPPCCGNFVCAHCPVDAKFTIANELAALFADPRVTLLTAAVAERVTVRGNVATGVEYRIGPKTEGAAAEIVGLGAGGIHNPFLLLRSGFEHPHLGRDLFEQGHVFVSVDLAGLDNFGGTALIGGIGCMLYGGQHRRHAAAALMEVWNGPDVLRDERGKWRQRVLLNFLFEDLPNPNSRVTVSAEDPARPVVEFAGRSPYWLAGVKALDAKLPALLAPLPVEGFRAHPLFSKSEAHLLGTTVMGSDPTTSIIDRDLVHHRVRNLLVLGSGAFPTGSPANPTLTLSALSLRAADRLLARGAT
jgi:choline dehydrogenase-like flavoprotein